jgi:radical SAM protein with 4Fe4S-binding SPASM domain
MICRHCSSVAERDAKNELSKSEIFEIIKKLENYGVFELFFDGGESLLRSDLVEICKFSSDIGITVSFSTNGYFFTDNLIKKVKSANIKKIQVSLDSASPETHDFFRNTPGSYDKTIECIKNLIKHKIKTIVACTISKYNYLEIKQIINLCLQLGVNDLIFTRPIHVGNAIFNNEIFIDKETQNQIYLDLISEKIKLQQQLNIKLLHNPILIPQIQKLKIPPNIKRELIQSLSCSAGQQMCWITSTGDVTPCPAIPLKLGNIRETSFEEIWKKNEVFNQLRHCKQFLETDCIKCKYVDLCEGGCHADSYGVHNNLFAKDPMCIL